MANLVHAFDFLDDDQAEIPNYLAVIGDDRFLKRLVLAKIRRDLTTEDEPVTPIEGSRAPWRDVIDELATISLFGDGPRIVHVNDAEEFVGSHRAQLEELVSQQSGTGRLILDLKSLASNTRLYKILADRGLLIECRPPQTKRGRSAYLDENRLRMWLRQWATSTHGIRLKRGADEELMQLIGPDLGLLDQELAKLALFCAPNAEVSIELVQQIVGGWRAKTTWELLDAALEGNAAAALIQLQRLLHAGEAPQAIAGAVLWSLRRFADAALLVVEAEHDGRKITLPAALEHAGFKKWPQGEMQRAERQLRQIGRERAGRLYQQLLTLDLAMKGSHSTPRRARWALEQLILSLSRQTCR